jgi:hypothetical protein
VSALALLQRLRVQDVHLQADDGKLRVNAPKGALTPELRAELAARKEEILAFLERREEGPAPPVQASPLTQGPLTYAQQRLWFLARLDATDPSHHESMGMRCAGHLSPAALTAALAAMIERHEVLRIGFAEVDGEPVQRVVPIEAIAPRFAVPIADLAALPEAARRAELERVGRDTARLPFDLGSPPLLRVLLVRLAGAEWQALFVIHHIVHDGWSGFVLQREVVALYEALTVIAATGRPSGLPRPAARYLDYARWERGWLRAAALERRVRAGVRRLADAPTVVTWRAADRPRPQRPSHRAGRRPFALPSDLASGLAEVARGAQASLFMTTLAAFGALLHLYTGQEDLLVASPVANRTQPGTEGVLGLFANLLVLRLDLSGNPGFAELLRRTRSAALAAFACQELPFECLVERLQPARSPAHPLLVQVHFSLESEALLSWEGEGVAMAPVAFDHGVTSYELDLNLVAAGGGLGGEIVYRTDLFDAATIDRAAGHFERLLTWATGDPEMRLARQREVFEAVEREARRAAARSLEEASRTALRGLPRRRAQKPLNTAAVPEASFRS